VKDCHHSILSESEMDSLYDFIIKSSRFFISLFFFIINQEQGEMGSVFIQNRVKFSLLIV
jgi:hypothetical protein